MLVSACSHPFQANKTEIEINESKYDERTGYVHIETSADDLLKENMEIVIPIGPDDKRIGLLQNVRSEDGGWFGSDKISFDVYIPPAMKEQLLPSLEKGKSLTVRGKAPFTGMMTMSVEMNRENYIKQMELTRYKDQLKAMFEHAHTLLPTPRLIAPPGKTKMGGMPNLPKEIAWPTSDGKPLSFIMQLKLSDFGSSEELKNGYLFLFMDIPKAGDEMEIEEMGEVAYRIIYYPKAGVLTEYRPFPDSLAEHQVIDETALRFSTFTMLPDPNSASARRLSLNESEQLKYSQLRTLFETMAFTGLFENTREYGTHRFLGYPDTGTDLQLYAEMDSKDMSSDSLEITDKMMDELSDDASKWRLLMQVDFDYSPLAATGLSGKYYFLIKKSDLEKKKYEEAVMYFESFE